MFQVMLISSSDFDVFPFFHWFLHLFLSFSISKTIAKEEMTFEKDPESMSREELEKLIGKVQKEMKKAAADLNFEAAAEYRDKMVKLKNMLRDIEE